MLRAFLAADRRAPADRELTLLVDLADTMVDTLVPRLEHHFVDPAHARARNATVAHVTDYLTGLVRHPAHQPESRLLVDHTYRVLAATILITLLPEARTKA